MTDTDITILKTDVMPEVYKITGVTGVKGGNIDHISATDDDSQILDSYFAEAAESLAEILSRDGYLSEIDSTSATYTLSMPANWKQSVLTALKKSMHLYLADYICMQWFNLSRKEEVEYYTNLCTELGLGIKLYLSEREKPTKTSH